jgi:CHASE3 domain sensor protein
MKLERKFLIIWLVFAIIMIFSFYLMINYERTTPTIQRDIPAIQRDTIFDKDTINLSNR